MKKRQPPNLHMLRRHIPNHDKQFFDQLVSSGKPVTSWSRSRTSPVPKNERRYLGPVDDDVYDAPSDDNDDDDVDIWSGNTPPSFFQGHCVIVRP